MNSISSKLNSPFSTIGKATADIITATRLGKNSRFRTFLSSPYEVIYFRVPENWLTRPYQQIVNPILLCDWSKENDIFDSCQVLSQHESEILNGRDQRLSFSAGSALRSALRVAKWKKIILNESFWDQGTSYLAISPFFAWKSRFRLLFKNVSRQLLICLSNN